MTVVDYRTDEEIRADEALFEDAGRLNLPTAPDVEVAVLGGILAHPGLIDQVRAEVDVDDFWDMRHMEIARAVFDVHAEQKPVDVVSVADELGRRGLLRKTGGADYLHELVRWAQLPEAAPYHAHTLRKYSKLRAVEQVGTRLQQLGRTSSIDDVDEAMGAAQRMLADAGTSRSGPSALRLADAIPQALYRMERPEQRLPALGHTGLRDMDDLMRMCAGDMTIVAARPGVGKTLEGVGVARATAIGHGTGTVIFTLEMTAQQITTIVLCAEAKINRTRAENADLTDAEWARVNTAVGRLAEAPFWIDDTESLDLATMDAKIRELQKHHDIGQVVLDYAQLMKAPRANSRQESVAELSRGLKLLAKARGVSLLTLCQLNRGPESRADKRPEMADLRESGAWEQDADNVVLLHREDAYEPESPRAGEIDLIVAKHRRGPRATVTAVFQGHYGRIAGFARDDEPTASPVWTPHSVIA